MSILLDKASRQGYVLRMTEHACPKPVGPGEIAEMVGLSRQRVDQLSRQRDFPEPWAELKTGRVWKDSEIEEWDRERKARG